MKILHLTLKKKWFDMILSGEKKEEYREVKDYWVKRLYGLNGCGTSYNFTIIHGREPIKYDFVVFKNGYSKDAPMMKFYVDLITVDEGKKKWGAPNHRVFVIKLGNRIETANIHPL